MTKDASRDERERNIYATNPLVNVIRLERSLCLLRRLNEARVKDRACASVLEVMLHQHDLDARNKTDPRQLTIYDAIHELG